MRSKLRRGAMMSTRQVLTIFLISLVLIFIAVNAEAVTVQATWNANSEADLAGYNIYRSTTSGTGYQQLNSALIIGTAYNDDIGDNVEDTFYYVVTAVDDSNNESGYSNEASISIDTTATLPPSGLSVQIP